MMDEPRYTDRQLMDGYFAAFREGGAGPNAWAFDEFIEMVRADPERLWRLTIAILKEATDPDYQSYVIAGPLEDLLRYHGEKFAGPAKALAQAEPWFGRYLEGVLAPWKSKAG